MKLHLTVLHDVSPDQSPTQAVVLYNPVRHEFVWNADFSAFRAVPLKWWDDASYIAYQASDIDDRDDHEAVTERMPVRVASIAPPQPSLPVNDDEILF